MNGQLNKNQQAKAFISQESCFSKRKQEWYKKDDIYPFFLFRYVASKDIHYANLAYTNFIKAGNQPTAAQLKVRRAPADEPSDIDVYGDSWINFTQLLLLTIQRDASDLFKELKSKYQGLYGSESNFIELMDDIGLVYFNIPKPRKQSNMLQEMMANLFGGGGSGAPQIGNGGSKVDLD